MSNVYTIEYWWAFLNILFCSVKHNLKKISKPLISFEVGKQYTLYMSTKHFTNLCSITSLLYYIVIYKMRL